MRTINFFFPGSFGVRSSDVVDSTNLGKIFSLLYFVLVHLNFSQAGCLQLCSHKLPDKMKFGLHSVAFSVI